MTSPAKYFFIGLLLISYTSHAEDAVTAANEIAQITANLGPKQTRKKDDGRRDRDKDRDRDRDGGDQDSGTGTGTTPSTPPSSPTSGYPSSDQDQDQDQSQDTGDQGFPTDGQGQQPTTPPGGVPGQPALPLKPGQVPPGIQGGMQPGFSGERMPTRPGGAQPQFPERTVPAGQVPKVAPTETKPVPVAPAAEKLEEELVGKDAQELYMEPGNYLKKAKALRKAQEGYELLRALLSSLEDNEKKLVEQRLALDKILQEFYAATGFSQGQLETRIKQLLENLAQDQSLDNELSEQERELQQELTQQIALLKKAQDDMAILGKLMLDLDKGLVKVTDQVAQVRDYEARAWKDYQMIDALRNDHEAMALANEINADDNSFVANTKKIQAWIQGPFNSFFTQTIATIKQQIQAIKTNLDDLDKQGVLLSQKTIDAEKAEADRRAAEEKARKDKEAAEKAAQQSKSFVNRVINFVTSIISSLVTGFKNVGQRIYSALFGWMSKK